MSGLSFASTGDVASQVYLGNLIWSVPVVIYLVIVRRRFFGATR